MDSMQSENLNYQLLNDSTRLDYSRFYKKVENFENDLGNWELAVDSYGTKVYRKFISSSGLYEYFVIGGIKNVLPDVCFRMYVDLIYRKKWDSYVKELYPFEEDEAKYIYWEVKYPFPLSNRDYTYRLKSAEFEEEGRHLYIIEASSFSSNQIPPKKGVVRVTDYHQLVLFTKDALGGTTMYMEYFDNPGGSFPAWLINWAAKSGIPDFLTICEQACLGYEMYLQTST